jgi:transposase, IS5 family
MLCIHFMQQWFSLSDPAMEEALHYMALFREFAQLDAVAKRLPYESSILRFRLYLEVNNLASQILTTVNANLIERGLLRKAGTVVDVTLIALPSSTKNSSGERVPKMHQTKKGNQWHFGIKADISADAVSCLVHTVTGTAANEHDITQAHALLHDQSTIAFAEVIQSLPSSIPLSFTVVKRLYMVTARAFVTYKQPCLPAMWISP